MKDKRVVVFFAAGFLIAAALGGIYFLIEDIKPMSGDDDRVVVAGGSLVIGSQFGWKQDPQDPFVANHKHQKRKVTGGVIIFNDGQPHYHSWTGGRIEFEIAYCNGICADVNNPDDKVTIKTDPDATHLRVFNTNRYHKLGDEAQAAPDPTTINHQPDWRVNRIRDVVNNNKDYKCDNGKCSVLPLYHCGVIGDCQ